MNSFNALSTENKVQGIWVRICTFSRLYILRFIERNASSFEGLTRATTPFGGNLVATKQANRTVSVVI